jgi:hypothetical protein
MWTIRDMPDAMYRYLRTELEKLNAYWKAKGVETSPECTHCAEFIKKLCEFVELKKIKDPEVLSKVYEPRLGPQIANYRLLSVHEWCAIFRLDPTAIEMEPLLACRCSELPTAGLQNFLERMT